MKKGLVVGQRIVDVVQKHRTSRDGKPVWDVTQLVLGNGQRLIFSVVELEGDYAIEAFVSKLTYLKKKPRGYRP